MRIYIISLLLSLAFFVLNCDDESIGSKTLDFGHFQITVPGNWESFKRTGVDSQVGGITDGRDTLSYDFGFYSYDLRHQTTDTHIRKETVIDGHDALVVRPKVPGADLIGVYIEVDQMNRLRMSGYSYNELIILGMFGSITFN